MRMNTENGNLDELRRLLADFYSLTGIKICIYDSEGDELCYYPERYTPFCRQLRSFPEMEERCRLCDRNALAECKRTQRAFLYLCHAGLTECMAPISLQGSIRGFIVIGQIREDSSGFAPEGAGGAVDSAAEEELAALWQALPVVPRQKIRAALHILEACAGYDQLKRFVQESGESLSTRLEAFVEAHLKENLDVGTLCRRFSLSRRELYELTHSRYHCTPAEFVRLRRLGCAARLLRETELSVTKIAEECGIGDYNYFSKVFRRAYGVSAREYRRNLPN